MTKYPFAVPEKLAGSALEVTVPKVKEVAWGEGATHAGWVVTQRENVP
jgi:hypothetical protein